MPNRDSSFGILMADIGLGVIAVLFMLIGALGVENWQSKDARSRVRKLAQQNAELKEKVKKLEDEKVQPVDSLHVPEGPWVKRGNEYRAILPEQILFESGSAEVKKDAYKMLAKISGSIMVYNPIRIQVEGHTDTVAISSRLRSKYKTNWELSTARAVAVVRFLQNQGVPPRLLCAVGYGQYRQASYSSLIKNRRLEIAIYPGLPDSPKTARGLK